MSVERALRFAEHAQRSVYRVLDQAVVGLILHGSLTLGDYIPGRSDVDLLAIVEDSLSDAKIAAIAEALAVESKQAPGRLDLRLVTRQSALVPTLAPLMETYITVFPGLEMGTTRVEGNHSPERDLVVEFSICRAHGRSLAGPEPSVLIGKVPDDWVLKVGDAQLADWERLPYDPHYGDLMILSACRLWLFCEEHRHNSKSAGAIWVLKRDPTLQVVSSALHRRRGDNPTSPIEEGPVRELLGIVRARVRDVLSSRELRLEPLGNNCSPDPAPHRPSPLDAKDSSRSTGAR
jgi:hypothetical protein